MYIYTLYIGMHSYQGRGAPEIDILESMSGDEKLINTKIHRPYFSTSLQIAPGMYAYVYVYSVYMCLYCSVYTYNSFYKRYCALHMCTTFNYIHCTVIPYTYTHIYSYIIYLYTLYTIHLMYRYRVVPARCSPVPGTGPVVRTRVGV